MFKKLLLKTPAWRFTGLPKGYYTSRSESIDIFVISSWQKDIPSPIVLETVASKRTHENGKLTLEPLGYNTYKYERITQDWMDFYNPPFNFIKYDIIWGYSETIFVSIPNSLSFYTVGFAERYPDMSIVRTSRISSKPNYGTKLVIDFRDHYRNYTWYK